MINGWLPTPAAQPATASSKRGFMSVITHLRHYWSFLRGDAQRQYNDHADMEMGEADRMQTEFLDDAVNRSVLVVRPAEPFRRWAAKVDEEMFAKIRDSLTDDELEYLKPGQDQLDDDHTAYLIPLQDSLEIAPKLLKAIHAPIFERELFTCCPDKSQWPKNRTLAMFRQWFDLELCGLAVDLCEGGIRRNGKFEDMLK